MFFDISPLEMVVLVVLAVVIFGPDKLPKLVQDAMGIIRKIREFSDSAKEDIRKELGPEYQDFEFQDLNPKTFVRKQMQRHGDEFGLGDIQELKNGFTRDASDAAAAVKSVRNDPLGQVAAEGNGTPAAPAAPATAATPDERPPYDLEAT
ncbi:Sec-independent protein translocase TatB [Streptacidiphilus pinicola]|uniref:Sec-independent protein translocase protein TatB n=1 Tax=Streptacidiphilus pinicola TaxID=2219663 RepID=A0A2X0IM28_9ACTN|nr:sec-independent translocase [Streptacidiphilus pinicola]RAG84663.1 Sec-independent protein translocase TatB [Streptacidiphilus pinicola]